MLVRAPNHLGDLVMALPALVAVPEADVLVARGLAPLLSLVPGFGSDGDEARRIIPLERGGRSFWRHARELRKIRYRRGVLLTPSFSSAFLFALGGVAERRGTRTDGRSLLLTDPVPTEEIAGLHRSAAYHLLATGELPTSMPVPRLVIPEPARQRWRELAGEHGDGPVIGIFPGSNASSRRWAPDRFAALVRRLAGAGARPIVFGGPQERDLGAQVAGDVALDVSGRTDLVLLAAGLADCDLVITNDSGPMHLAAAVGTRTVALFGAGDATETGPLGKGHVVLHRTDLPCVPCVKNTCTRKGRGFILDDADRECLNLIDIATVEAAVHSELARSTRTPR